MKRLAQSPYLGTLLLILAVKAVIMLWLILSGPIGLSPDEAQYWTWSQHLDYSYYSKPGGIAWEIGLGTLFFGNTELGVRIGAVILALFLPLALYLLGRSCQLRPHAAFLAALTMVLTPLGILASILSITDTGMILFWTLAAAVVAKALARDTTPNYLLVGLCIALGSLFKWPIFLLWSFIIGMAPYYKNLRSPKLIAGIAISLMGFIPTLIWNGQHGWVSFLHVLHGVGGSDLAPKEGIGAFQGNFFDFLGAQLALASPLIFILIIAALFLFLKERKATPKPLTFCALVTLFLFVFFGFLALFKKVQGNWCDFAYPTAFILLGWHASESRAWHRWLIGGLTLSVILTFFALAIPTIQSHSLFSSVPIPYRYNPFRHNIGWEEISSQLQAAGYDAENQFLFSSSYQTTSILNFYGPWQKKAYFFNLHTIRNNQFSLWPGMDKEQVGNDGYYAIIENIPHLQKKEATTDAVVKLLSPYFSEVSYLGSYPLFHSYGKPVKGMLLFHCRQYNGKKPTSTERY